jgi:hypothetical protein
VMEELKKKAKSRGLWNLWMAKRSYPEGVDLTNLEVSATVRAESGKLEPVLNFLRLLPLFLLQYGVMCEV